MTIEERDKLRARRVLHYVDRSVKESAKVAERERRNMVMRNETGALGASVKDTGWNGVPQGIPNPHYPNKPRRPRYRKPALPEPVNPPREQVLMAKPAAPVLVAQRASDARGRREGTQPFGIGIRIWEPGHDDIVVRGHK